MEKTGRITLPRLLVLLMSAIILIVPTVSSLAQDNAEISVSLNPDTISLDEQAILQISVSGVGQNKPDLQMPSLSAFEVYSQGQSTNVSIINGVMSSSITYQYLLLPHKVGTFQINGISITVKGSQVVGNKVTLTVVDKGRSSSPQLEDRATDNQGGSRDYFLQAVVDKKNPFVNEQVTLTLKFYIGVQFYSSPELAEPSTTGFWTEVLGNTSPYFQKVNNRNYRVIERKYALFPTQTGELSIGNASITTTVASRNQRRDPYDLFGDMFPQGSRVTARSDAIKLNVRQIPSEGRPSEFSGTIGKFRIRATADKTTVEANQPVTVAIEIQGTGNIKSVAEPVIPDLPDFRVYRASSNEKTSRDDNRLGGAKVYEEVFIPKRPGQLEIPSLSLTFFDPVKEKYETVKTNPIILDVKKPEGYVSSPDVPYSGPTMTIGNQSQDIRFIKDKIGNLQPYGHLVFKSPGFILVNIIPVLALIGLVVNRKRQEKLTGNIGLARSKRASKLARKRLTRAQSLASLPKSNEFYGELNLAVTAYVADKLNISPHGLTNDQLSKLLSEKGISTDLLNDTLTFLRQCDFARFAPASLTQEDLNNSLKTAEEIMVRMEEVKFA